MPSPVNHVAAPVESPVLPSPKQTLSVIQNQTTGVVDFLQYSGSQLVASSAHDYGLGSDFKIVASGNFGTSEEDGTAELVAQSRSTGQLDFLTINASGTLVASFLTSFGLPQIHGQGFFGTPATGQTGPELIAQLADGSLDFLAFDSAHNFIASDLVANTKGLPTLVGGGNFQNFLNAQFNSLNGDSETGSVVTQLSDGTLDGIGFSGSFGAGTLTYDKSFLLSQTKGSAKAVAVNLSQNGDVQSTGGDGSGVQVYTESTSAYDVLYLDSGYSSSTQGLLYGSTALQSYAGWDVVDGGSAARLLFGSPDVGPV